MDAYWKYQAEKEKKLYAIYDAFSQNNGHTNVTDARYVNAIKLFLTGVSPGEHAAHLGFAFTGRQMGGIGARVAAQMQSIDELRHIQTQIHAMSHYNKFFDGFDEFNHMHDRVWYLSVPKSFFEDARAAGDAPAVPLLQLPARLENSPRAVGGAASVGNGRLVGDGNDLEERLFFGRLLELGAEEHGIAWRC